jgi:hypothetical protein
MQPNHIYLVTGGLGSAADFRRQPPNRVQPRRREQPRGALRRLLRLGGHG